MDCKYTFQCRQIERINLSLKEKKKCMSFYAGFTEASFNGYVAPNIYIVKCLLHWESSMAQ